MKLKIVIMFAFLCSLFYNPSLKSQLVENELKNSIIELSDEKLEALGINVKNSSIELISNDVVISNKSKTTYNVNRKIIIKGDRINLKSPKSKELKSCTLFPLRIAVLTSKNKTYTYFSKITKVNEYLLYDVNNEAHAMPPYSTDIVQNNWKALHIKLDNKRDVYLWFDPSDLITKPDELEKTTEPIKDAGFMENIRIAPNPTKDGKAQIKFLLKNDATISISLYDISGQKVVDILTATYKSSGDYTFNINAEALADGMYLVLIQNDKGEMITQKIIKCSY